MRRRAPSSSTALSYRPAAPARATRKTWPAVSVDPSMVTVMALHRSPACSGHARIETPDKINEDSDSQVGILQRDGFLGAVADTVAATHEQHCKRTDRIE